MKPGLMNSLLAHNGGLAPHERNTARRRKRTIRPNQKLVPQIGSDGEFWAVSGAMKSINSNLAVEDNTINHVPRTHQQKMAAV